MSVFSLICDIYCNLTETGADPKDGFSISLELLLQSKKRMKQIKKTRWANVRAER